MQYDIFVSYHEAGAESFAEAIYDALTERGYSVYVNHIFKREKNGKFRENINEIIDNCKVFILLNTYDSLNRGEIIREVIRAFPLGVINKHEFWIFKDKSDRETKYVTDTFRNETGIDLSEFQQIPFEDKSDLYRTLMRKCDQKRLTIINTGGPDSSHPFKLDSVDETQISSLSSIIKIKNEFKILESDKIKRLRELANRKLGDNQLFEAEKLFEEILVLDSLNISALNGLGLIQSLRKNYDEANHFFLKRF